MQESSRRAPPQPRQPRSDLAAAHELVPVAAGGSVISLLPGWLGATSVAWSVPRPAGAPGVRLEPARPAASPAGRPAPGGRPTATDVRPAPDASGTTATLDRGRPAHLRCCGWATTIRVIYHTLDRGSVREPRVRRDRAPLTTTSRAAESRLAAPLRSGRHEAKPVRPEGGRDIARRTARRPPGWPGWLLYRTRERGSPDASGRGRALRAW